MNGTGLIPRDFKSHPVGCMAYAPAFDSSLLIPEVEWDERLAEQKANKSSLLDIREAHYDQLKSLNQGQYGLCWAFSTTKAVMYIRATNNQKAERLSAWYVAGKIMKWRDEGYYGAASLKFIRENGVPQLDFCPSYYRQYDTTDAKENAALHKVEEWWDGSDDPDVARHQAISMLLVGIPCVADLNSMGHSMCLIGIESLNPLKYIYDNSWGEQGDKGLYHGKGADTVINGLVIPRVVSANP